MLLCGLIQKSHGNSIERARANRLTQKQGKRAVSWRGAVLMTHTQTHETIPSENRSEFSKPNSGSAHAISSHIFIVVIICAEPRRRYCNWLAILVRKLHIHKNRVKLSLALILSYTFQDLEHSPRAKSSYTQKSKPATTATAVRPAHYFVATFFAHQNQTLFFRRAARSMFIFNNQLIFSSHLHCSMCVCVCVFDSIES